MVELRCVTCQHANLPGSRFCSACGLPFVFPMLTDEASFVLRDRPDALPTVVSLDPLDLADLIRADLELSSWDAFLREPIGTSLHAPLDLYIPDLAQDLPRRLSPGLSTGPVMAPPARHALPPVAVPNAKVPGAEVPEAAVSDAALSDAGVPRVAVPEYAGFQDQHSVTATAPTKSPESSERRDPKVARRAAVRRRVVADAGNAVLAVPWSRTVLLLTDHDGDAEWLRNLLEEFGFATHRARNWVEGQRLVDRQSFDVAFFDVARDGFSDTAAAAELCELVKHPPLGRPLPIKLVVIANGSRPADRVRATLAGADGFVVKPLDRGMVAHVLERCEVPLPLDPRQA